MTASLFGSGTLDILRAPGTMVDRHGDQGAVFSINGVHRYVLWRLWRDAPPLAVIGLNPSTADALIDDPTVRRCIRYALDWQHGGLVMLNLFSLRSTDPAALRWRRDDSAWPESVTGDPANMEHLLHYTSPARAGAVLAAWGNHGWIAGRGPIVCDMLRREGVMLLALGVTKQHRPLHPLYVPRDRLPTPYTI